MYWTQKHVLVCTASHCAQKGSNDLIGRLRLEIVRKKLDAEILVNNCGTIDLCDIGPNVVIYPDNVILSGVTAKDVPALVRYLRGEGDPPGEITGYAVRQATGLPSDRPSEVDPLDEVRRRLVALLQIFSSSGRGAPEQFA